MSVWHIRLFGFDMIRYIAGYRQMAVPCGIIRAAS